MIRFDLSKCIGFHHHRSGWNFCLSQLHSLHSKSGILLDGFIERSFAWQLKSYYNGNNDYNLPYEKDWVGFLHNPPNIPEWFDNYSSPQSIINRRVFQESLQTCICLITLSDYLKDWLISRVNVPVISVKHPTEIPENKWQPERFFSNHRQPIVQIGYWLRNLGSFAKLKCGPIYEKVWLPSSYEQALKILNVYNKTQSTYHDAKYEWSGVKIFRLISNAKFDDLMCRCITFLDLYDSSANNAIVESISRNTPILVNKIPPVVEYLGDDYPLYFNNLYEASDILKDPDRIINAHYYLKHMDKKWISGKYFCTDVAHKVKQVL